jgi:hypothetical protein
VELQGIVDRYAEGLAAIDALNYDSGSNPRTGEPYLPGLMTLSEQRAVELLDAWWWAEHPDDFVSPSAHRIQVPYPRSPRNKCDQIITTSGTEVPPEWAIEAKYIRHIGNNGKRNDYGVGKALSPYLKDRSLFHDILRLREEPLARRLAVVAFSFRYDATTCAEAARLHPEHADRILEIQKVCRDNGGAVSVRPIAEFAHGIFVMRELVEWQFCKATFEAWRHPCGGKGVVFGWEVRRSEAPVLTDDW